MKRFLAVTGLLLVLVLAATFLWLTLRPRPAASPDRIPLPDGSWVHLEAVTYGTNHLVGPRLSLLANRLSPGPRNILLRTFGRHAAIRFSSTTATPQLVLWLNRGTYSTRFPSGLGFMECVITDTNGDTSGEVIRYDAPYPLEAKPFNVFPRREPEFLLKIYHHDPQGEVSECGQMCIANPLYRRYPQWQPEPLPATKNVGDVEATLHQLLVNQPEDPNSTNQLHRRIENRAHLTLRSLSDTNIHWRVAGVEVSDATGNSVKCTSLDWGGYGKDWFTFAPGLWTNEAAWKLNLEIKRTAGFTPAEQFTFRNVPLGALNTTNRVGWTTNFNGVTVTLDYVFRRPPHTNEQSWSSRDLTTIGFRTAGLTNGLHLDLLSTRADTGVTLTNSSWGSGGDERTYRYRNVPADATTADFTFTVQQSRQVEFLVKP